MQNPKYKFFRHELEDHEVLRYNTGVEIGGNWSTPEIAAEVERITAELEKRGYKRTVCADHSMISFAKPEDYSSAYVGTFVNPFSFKDKIFWYSNIFMTSYKTITIKEVFRSNGTDKNVSIAIGVTFSPGGKSCNYLTSKNNTNPGQLNKYGLLIPETYLWCSGISSSVTTERIRKFKPSISEKLLIKTIDAAETALQTYEISDMSQFEADCNNFPKDTTKEYWAWRKEVDKNN